MTKTSIVIMTIFCASIAFANDDKPCTNATLNGAYGFLRNGHAVADSYITAVGVVTFDTIGNMTGHEALSTNGVFSHADIQQKYAINTDCTGQIFDTNGTPIQKIYVSGSGDRALGMSIESGRTDWIEFARVARNAYADDASAECTVKNMAAAFVFQRMGRTPTGELLATGILTIDGHGTATAIQTTEKNTVITSSAPIVGPYTVNADCTGTFIDRTGKVFAEFVATHGREELFALSETSGNNVFLKAQAEMIRP